MDEKVYVTKHIEDGCSCAPIFASQVHLSQILCNEQGSIPLICPFKVVTADNEKPQVELIESGPGVNYVAISHIWSDGLSNVNENSIPQCQFNRLSRLVGNLYDGTQMPFWLDTLCFPLQPTEAYNLALIGMRKTYEEAHKVLVLDRYLQEQEAKHLTLDEIVTRIVCSPWNRRLWTLQEGALAKSLAFQFADDFVDLSDNLTRGSEKEARLGDLVFSNIWVSFMELRAIELRDSKVLNAPAAKSALAFRSTSVASDEALCLGTLLGLDPAEIVNTPTEDRMKKIWSLEPEYYAATVFWTGPKL